MLPARVAELVDAHVSGACIERCAGSSPVPGTKKKKTELSSFFSLVGGVVSEE